MTNKVKPTGFCFDGCGRQIGFGRFFAPGHDKTAEAAFLAIHHQGTVAQMLHDHGYGSDEFNSVTRTAVDEGHWNECPRDGCNYRGMNESIINHIHRYHDRIKP